MNYKFLNNIIEQEYRQSRKEYKATEDAGEKEIKLSATSPKFKLENLIFKKPLKIQITKSTEIEIKNCQFNSSLIITPDSANLIVDIEVSLFKTEVNDNVKINRMAAFKSISFDCCVAQLLFITDVTIAALSFYKSEIIEIDFEGTRLQNLNISDNYLSIIKYESLKVDNCRIDLESFLSYHKKLQMIDAQAFVDKKTVEEWKSKQKEYTNLLSAKDIPKHYKTKEEYVRDVKHNIKVSKDTIRDHKKHARKYLSNFLLLLKKSTHESIDNYVMADLNYLYYKNKKYNPAIWIILLMLGFFYKPSRVVLSSVLSILFFGLGFYMLGHANSKLLSVAELLQPSYFKAVLGDLANSIYFSGITFYTIGYSDLPGTFVTGNYIFLKQFIVLLEAAIGIIFTSAILISFINKYLKEK